ncbi:single-stranded DNA-binding protein [Candidatus Gracilibacteria bacterium]|jgi:single-strand DNA-binding protein|nr:single-stranded DNA-binding protein [Candidatus Gracilibacteria bacterium]MBP7057603.1 single-stranded DNA-binding protein [Candidatus Gracilibacteria bacterium]
MRSLNKAMLMGNLAADPDEKSTTKGASMVSFPLATNREYEVDGEKKKTTDFHRIIIWGKLAQVAKQYLAKGSAVYIEGRIVNRAYDAQSGDRRFITEIVADDLNIITWKHSASDPKAGELASPPVN